MAIRECIPRLVALGISEHDALTLRRASMTLHRWFELECGDGNDYGSWCITRGTMHKEMSDNVPVYRFEHDDDGAPYMERHHFHHGRAKDSVFYSRLADRETGARKRIAAILARYSGLSAYVQTDPRGCSLYILRPNDVPAGADVSAYYTRGIAVFQ